MNFQNQFYFGGSVGHFGDEVCDNMWNTRPAKRPGVPDQYQEFLPENIVKDKISNPYGYDPFIIYFNEKAKEEPNGSLYTDRLLQWDYQKTERLLKKHMPEKRWDNAGHKQIEAFLCDWTEKKVVFIANIQYVNLASGYPLWRLDYYYE